MNKKKTLPARNERKEEKTDTSISLTGSYCPRATEAEIRAARVDARFRGFMRRRGKHAIRR